MAGYMATAVREDWETPQELFEELNREFNFELDVCADESNRKCERYFTKTQNGLAQSWGGVTAWCNPPYGRDIASWVKKAAEESGTVVMLLPARTDTRWFHEFVWKKTEIRFIKGRLKFGGAKASAPFASMVVIFRR